MRKNVSKVTTVVMSLMMMLSVGIEANAKNYTDTYHTARLNESTGEAVYYTPGRAKQDYSSGYVKNVRSSYSGPTYFTMVASAGNGSNTYYQNFKLWTYTVRPGEYKYLTNYVKESGYNYAALKVEPGISTYVETYFAWSPDSY